MKALLSFAPVMIFSAASYAWDEPEDFRGLKWSISSGEAESQKLVKSGIE